MAYMQTLQECARCHIAQPEYRFRLVGVRVITRTSRRHSLCVRCESDLKDQRKAANRELVKTRAWMRDHIPKFREGGWLPPRDPALTPRQQGGVDRSLLASRYAI